MKKIYLVRHGQTDANASNILQDGTATLSEKGFQQAAALTERLKHLPFDHLLVSDYERTRQTVSPLLPYISVVPMYTPLVRETKRPSQFAGLSNELQAFLDYCDESDIHISDPDWRFEDEENFHDVVARVKNFFAHIDTLEGDTVVVTHGRFIIYVILSVISNFKLDEEMWVKCRHGFETYNTGISMLGFNEKRSNWKLLSYNDRAHFAE